MAANINPLFSIKGNLTANGGTTMVAAMLTATGDFTGVSANHVLVHTAGIDGSFVRGIKCVAAGTNVASVMRVYLNNGSTNATATNNQAIGHLSLPATTLSNTAATAEPEMPLNLMLPAGFRLYAGLGTTVAAGWIPTAITGDY